MLITDTETDIWDAAIAFAWWRRPDKVNDRSVTELGVSDLAYTFSSVRPEPTDVTMDEWCLGEGEACVKFTLIRASLVDANRAIRL